MEPLELQRLVDGELDAHERRRLLQRCDEEPPQWRTLALSLLEEQSFRKEVALFAKGTAANEPIESTTIALPTNPKDVTASNTKHAWGPLALAASLLIAVGFFTGYGLNSINRDAANPSTGPMNTALVTGSSNIAQAKPEASPSGPMNSTFPSDPPRAVGELRFVRDESMPKQSEQVGVPIYEVRPDHIQQMMEQQFRQISEWNRQNRNRGVQIDWKPEMLESQLPDGRAVVVPINQWNVRPIGQ
jgi:hypothetical protein